MRDTEGFNLAFAKHLTCLLEEKGLSINEVGRRTGLTLQKTIQIYSGQVQVNLKTGLALADAMEIPYTRLFEFDYRKYL